MLSAEFIYSEDFLNEALLHHGKTKTSRKVFSATKVVCLVLLLGLSALMFVDSKFIGGAIFIGFSALLIFSRSIDGYFVTRRFRKSPYWNSRIKMLLDESGVSTVSELGTTSLRWNAFTAAIGLKEGFLLYQGPGVFNWLPTRFFTQPDRTQIADFLKSQVKKYEERA
jgi:hypothetical protein